MSNTEKLSIALTPELARRVHDAVDGGEYATVSEVIREALRGWLLRREDDARIKRLWDEGLASGEPQERQPLEEFLKEAHARLAKSRAA